MQVDVTSVLNWALLALLILALSSVVGLVQIIKWILIGKGLLERREHPLGEEKGK